MRLGDLYIQMEWLWASYPGVPIPVSFLLLDLVASHKEKGRETL